MQSSSSHDTLGKRENGSEPRGSIESSKSIRYIGVVSGAMNPLTQVRNTQRISRQEVVDGASGKASWHDQFRHSAYVYAGGLPYQLTEGDVLAVFSQYGQIVDVNLPKDKETGKTRG